MSQMKQAPTSKSGDAGRLLRLSRSTSFLIVIIFILAYEAVSSPPASELQAAKVDQLGESKASNLLSKSADKSRMQQDGTQQAEGSTNKTKLGCEYDKGQWNFCEADGSQTKVLRLKSGNRDCKANKTIRRDCETVGCKYARGQWSSACLNGQRFRVDTLIGRIGGPGTKLDCKPSRRVTKDCRRTCHYVKSAWSECVNGTRTRLLRLASDESELNQANGGAESLFTPVANNNESPLTRRADSRADSTLASSSSSPKTTGPREKPLSNHQGQQCAPRKLIKRACRLHPGASRAIASGVPPLPQAQAATSNAGPSTNAARRSYQPSSSTTAGPTSSANNMTPAQKRRSKLMQAKQQQQSGGPKSAANAARESTATNQPVAATGSKKSDVRDRRR